MIDSYLEGFYVICPRTNDLMLTSECTKCHFLYFVQTAHSVPSVECEIGRQKGAKYIPAHKVNDEIEDLMITVTGPALMRELSGDENVE